MATLGDKAVGSIVKLNVNGTATEFIIVHQGLPSSMYDSSCNGTWLLMKDVYTTMAWDSNTGNYSASGVHTYLNSTFIGLLEDNIRDQILQAKIPYCSNYNNNTILSGANGLSTKIFLLSGYELGWTTKSSSNFRIDGACLNYFEGLPNTSAKRIGYYSGNAQAWWTRSPFFSWSSSQYSSLLVDATGYFGGTYATNINGIRPALILPTKLKIDDSGLVVVGGAINGYVNIGGAQKELVGGYVNIGGTWKEIVKQYTNVGGVWKE